jgi:hypothetical protein
MPDVLTPGLFLEIAPLPCLDELRPGKGIEYVHRGNLA